MIKQLLHANLDSYLQQHRRGWTLDTAQRYLAVRSIIEQKKLVTPAILDVGSNGMGLAFYWENRPGRIVDFDSVYPAYRFSNYQVQGTAERLPFGDRSFPVVMSVDMLEHVPPDKRPAVIEDMLRVTARLFILAVPTGQAAVAQDAQMAQLYRDRQGQLFKFVEEHIQYGLPEAQAISGWIDTALTRLKRSARVETQGNANVFLRSIMMRWYVENRWGLIQKVAVLAMPWLYRLSWGPHYREVFIVGLEAEATQPRPVTLEAA